VKIELLYQRSSFSVRFVDYLPDRFYKVLTKEKRLVVTVELSLLSCQDPVKGSLSTTVTTRLREK
jgi:hypothetical protein